MDRILISECEVDIANGDLVLTHRVKDGDHYVVTRGAA